MRERAVAANPVDGAVARGRDDPAGRIRRHTSRRPPFDRSLERVLERVFGEGEVAGRARERRGRTTPLLPEDAFYVLDGSPVGIGASGRTSIEPPWATDGTRAAHSIASSMLSTSIL